MNTIFLLMAEFGSATIPLADVAERYLGMARKKAFQRACANQLPFPAQRYGGQKSGWFVHIQHLATHIDDTKLLAEREWRKFQ